MIKFNDNNIFVGYIKQLLNSFNLPKYRIYTAEDERYFEENKKEAPDILKSNALASKLSDKYIVNYIKKDKISYYDDYGWHSSLKQFIYNQKDYNSTRKLALSNGNVYDSDTHEYLGDYLRFQRDYLGLNLMPLYNCFSNRQVGTLYVVEDRTDKEHFSYFNYNINFDSTDTNYKIYMLPVKLFKEYTIAMECEKPVEIFCGLYSGYFNSSQGQDLIPLTYKKYNALSFDKPVIYDKLTANYLFDDTQEIRTDVNKIALDPKPFTNKTYLDSVARYFNLSKLALNERSLKMFIKLPADIKTSIVILEGNYIGYNNSTIKKLSYLNKRLWKESSNRSIINYETERQVEVFAKDKDGNIQYTEVFEPNTGKLKQVPVIAGYVTEYNPELDERQYNFITNLQLLDFNTKSSYPFADRLMEYLLENTIDIREDLPDNINRVEYVMDLNGIKFDTAGMWDNKIRPYIYDYMNDYQLKNIGSDNHDILGYIDKDVERYYASWNYTYLLDSHGLKIPLTDERNNILWQYWQDIIGSSNDENGNVEGEPDSFNGTLPATAYSQAFWAQSTEIITDENGTRKPLGYRMKKAPKATIMNADIYKDKGE